MSHTPGPWHVHPWGDNSYEINSTQLTVCNVPGFSDETVDSGSAESNARLIAAAPDLLEALEGLMPMWESGIDEPWVRKARAAIKKAKGE